MQLGEHCKNIEQNLSFRMLNDYKKKNYIPSLVYDASLATEVCIIHT